VESDDGLLWMRSCGQDSLASLVPRLRRLNPRLPLIVLSDEPDEAGAFSAISLGAVGYCNSHAAPEVLQTIARVVSSGGLWLGQAMMRKVLQSLCVHLDDKASKEGHKETYGEARLATLLIRGANQQEIASELNIPEAVVAQTISALFARNGVQDRLQLLVKTLISR